ncbi:MAG: radical SAM protein [Deltaproteobacteria bacterium]|nr:radical SAM protein [Deltaproteobacteria bacterium]
MPTDSDTHPYRGFEQGPIRPPSEAQSLLVRITRNCHWNRCTFCPVYKGERFSVRPVGHVLRDLDAIAAHVETLTILSASTGLLLENDVRNVFASLQAAEKSSFRAALSWFLSGRGSVFLQDADCLVLKPAKIITILKHLKSLFPTIERITSYSRSDTIDRIPAEDLAALNDAGLNRIHIGMESGSDTVLSLVCKGVSKEIHIRAGRKVKEAGIELSEYYMPGLGGIDHYRENATETADAMTRINPDFIRLRTLALPSRAPLLQELRAGRFRKCPEVLAVEEILLFLENLGPVTSCLASDHILNLFPELEGKLPDDKDRLTGILENFLALDRNTRFLYQLGRRLGIFTCLTDLEDPLKVAETREAAAERGASPDNVDEITDAIVQRFI